MSRRAPAEARPVKGSPVGGDLVEAFREMAAYLRGEVEVESYEVPDDVLTPQRVKAIRRKVAASTKEFERRFRISARTMEAYEQGRRRPDAAMQTLLRVIEREPEAVRRALAS
jgi:putative transcriptional regulator